MVKCGISKTNVDYDFTKVVWLAFGRQKPEMGLNMKGLISVIMWEAHHLGMMGRKSSHVLIDKESNASLKKENFKKLKKPTAPVKMHLWYCMKCTFKRQEFKSETEELNLLCVVNIKRQRRWNFCLKINQVDKLWGRQN